MTKQYVSGLWNAVDSLLAFWAKELTESLDANAPPPPEFWEALYSDLTTAKELALKARDR